MLLITKGERSISYRKVYDNLLIKEIGKRPVLTKIEEIALMQDIEKLKDVSSNEVHDELIKEKARCAREKMIYSNMRLVVSIANRYSCSNFTEEDIIQEGILGLMEAIDHFDYKKGFKFSTYATFWIRKAITRAIANKGNLIHIPIYLQYELSKLNRLKKALEISLNRIPTKDEVMIATGFNLDKLNQLELLKTEVVSLDKKLNEDTTLGDLQHDEVNVSPDLCDKESTHDIVIDSLSTLSHRDREIIMYRYGLNEDKEHTFEEIAIIFGITKERARQIVLRSLLILKKNGRFDEV